MSARALMAITAGVGALAASVVIGASRRRQADDVADGDGEGNGGAQDKWVAIQAPGQPCESELSVLVISSQRVLDAVGGCKEIMLQLIADEMVGMDCEWEPEHKGESNRTAVIQISGSNKCVIVQPLNLEDSGNGEGYVIPPFLHALLEDPHVIKVGVGIQEDVRRLRRDFGIQTQSAVDIHVLVKQYAPEMLSRGGGLQRLCEQMLGIHVDKKLQCSSWSKPKLSKEQVRYAALDAWLSRQLVLTLHQRCTACQLGGTGGSQPQQAGNVDENETQKTRSGATGMRMTPGTRARPSIGDAAPGPMKGTTIGDAASGPMEGTRNGDTAPRTQTGTANRGATPSPQIHPTMDSAPGIQAGPSSVGTVPEPTAGPTTSDVASDAPRHAASDLTSDAARDASSSGKGTPPQAQLDLHDFLAPFFDRFTYTRLPCNDRLMEGGCSERQHGHPKGRPPALKPLKPQSMPARKSLLYENCRLLAPDSKVLCTCSRKKAQWYVERGIATIVEEDPLTVRLTFEPRGRGNVDDEYYLADKENRCCVCGNQGEYLRHQIVPRCYRSRFPERYKTHLSHDIVLMCRGCHQVSGRFDQQRMEQLGEEHGAPLAHDGRKFANDKDVAEVRSAARALVNPKERGKIPVERVSLLEQVVCSYFDTMEFTQDLLHLAATMDPRRPVEEWTPHADKVVGGLDDPGIEAFVRGWRRHFLSTMKPRFLPPHWSVNSRVANSSLPLPEESNESS